MGTGMEEFFEKYQGNDNELKITILVTWEQLRNTPQKVEGDFDVWCHTCLLPPRPRDPVKVLIKGAPRNNPLAKDSKWISDRKGLEDDKDPDVHEVILMTETGELMEGTQTNFYAVKDKTVVTANEGIL